MTTTGTICPHKKIDMLTWELPDGKMKNEIDHTLVNSQEIHNLGDKTPGREISRCPGGGVLSYMGYIGMCGPKGYCFSAVLVINWVSILAILPPFWS